MTDLQIKQFDDIKRHWVGKYLDVIPERAWLGRRTPDIGKITGIGVSEDDGIITVEIHYCNVSNIVDDVVTEKFKSLEDFEEYLKYYFSSFEHFSVDLDVVNGFDYIHMGIEFKEYIGSHVVSPGSRIRYVNVTDVMVPFKNKDGIISIKHYKEHYFVYEGRLCRCVTDNFFDYCVGADDNA